MAAVSRSADPQPEPAPSGRPVPGRLERLLSLTSRLRDPEGGCPWDLRQDLTSFVAYLRDEAAELEEAIARDDLDHVQEELGDCLWVIAFLVQLVRERGGSVDEIGRRIEEKIVRRHPHVFGDETAQTPEDAERIYLRVKAEERAARVR